MRRHNFTCENFGRKIGKKNFKHAHKIDNNGQKVNEIPKKQKKLSLHEKISNFAQSQINFAPSHDGETVTLKTLVGGPGALSEL